MVWCLGELSHHIEADLNRIQAVAIANELSMVTWREILWSLNSDLPN